MVRQKKSIQPIRIWTVFVRAFNRFNSIDGSHRAAAFAYFAFFALFPLAILFITIASDFISQDFAVQQATHYIQSYLPLTDRTQTFMTGAISGLTRARARAGTLAFLSLFWVAVGFITTLLSAADRAWNIPQSSWWKLPLKGFILLVCMMIALLLGIFVPLINRFLVRGRLLSEQGYMLVFILRHLVLPLVVSFFSLLIFYKLAPQRPTRFTHVWLGALSATVLLAVAESLFVSYLTKYASLNAVYGTFGGIIALLLWVYISGGILIYGACLCACQAELEEQR